MMLTDYSKTLYEVYQGNKRYCIITASVTDQKLHIHRIDFEQWEYNSRTGQVEGVAWLDEINTRKLCNQFNTISSPSLVSVIKREFGADGLDFFLINFREFCDEHDIKYNHEAWY